VAQYVANCEKAGVPAVALGFADQINFARNVALINGSPNIRWIDVPRVGSAVERVATFIDKALKALTEPLTAKEKESGLYTPPEQPKVVFEGTLEDAQVFFQQTTPVANCRNCPIAKMTDGLPIIIPTEEKVKEMLTGTSHKPEEAIYLYSMNATSKKIDKAASPVLYARAYNATVEKVAVVAVMSGCRPEYLPVVLTVASLGGGSTSCPGTSGQGGYMYVVSGSIAKEIGMNAGQNALDVGNPANMTIGRSSALMTINFGQCITGVVRTDAGGPVHSISFSEDDEGLPQGWETLREEGDFKKTESAIGKLSTVLLTSGPFQPSAFRSLISTGTGGIARKLGVEGIPGPHNYLEYVIPELISVGRNAGSAGTTFIMHLNQAKSLYDYGFKTKAAVYVWMWNNKEYWITVGDYKNNGNYDFSTNAGGNKETTSGKAYKDLPDDYPIPSQFIGNKPNDSCIIVSDSFADEHTWIMPARPRMYPIDQWK
jgi:hypothetical protein